MTTQTTEAKKATTYTLVQRNPNSWTGTPHHVKQYAWEADCGHKHRTLEGAVKCAQHYSKINSQLGFFGRIEDNATGQPVNDELIHDMIHG